MTRAACLVTVLAGSVLTTAAFAQTPPLVRAPQPAVRQSGQGVVQPQRETLQKFMRPVTIDLKETRLEEAMTYLKDITQADLEVMWQDDRNNSGLEKDTAITLKVERVTALDFLEKLLERATTDLSGPGGNSWQLTEGGTMQIGPKERLNKFRRVELYTISDLLLEVPNYTDAPTFDLQSVLQNSGQGGGGGQSPFREENQQREPGRSPTERAQEVQELIQSLVEPEQWVDNGGDGASARFFQGSLIINAPDYVHRQINGYPYWPAASTRVASVKGRRYVTLGVDTSTSTLQGFTETPVTAVVGGRIVSSDPRRGPGGSKAPAEDPAKPKEPK